MPFKIYDLEQQEQNQWYCCDIFLEGFDKIVDDFFGSIKQEKYSKIFFAKEFHRLHMTDITVSWMDKIQLIRTDDAHMYKTEFYYDLTYKLGPWVDNFISNHDRIGIGVTLPFFKDRAHDYDVDTNSNYKSYSFCNASNKLII